MKNMSIKTSILLPVIAMLVIGITLMIVIVGSVSSITTNNITDSLVSAKVSEYANKFEAMCMEAYGTAISLAPVIQDNGETVENPRDEAVTILTGVLQANRDLVSIWTVWEPDAFDGRDREYAGAENHDATGRFIPFVFKDGGTYTVGYIPDYETGDFYQGARNSGKPHITDPYECEFAGQMIPVYSITVPIMKNGVFAGAVGIDINLGRVINTMNAGSILDEGYLFVLSPDGTIAAHRNSELILDSYESMWLRHFKPEINTVLMKGGNFTGKVYSDLINEDVSFLASGVMIGDTGRYWAVCGVIPVRIVTASSTRLIRDVVLVGSVMIAVIGLTVLLIVRNRLKRLPIITTAAEAMAQGKISLSRAESSSAPTKNEIIMLGRAFSAMAEGVKAQADAMTLIADGDYSIKVPMRSDDDVMNEAINNMIGRTNSVMNEIRASSEQVSTGSRQIATGAQSLAQGATEQASAIEQLSASISKIADKTIKNAVIARESADLSDVINGSAVKSSGQMDNMMQAMREINEASNQIGKVIKVIDDIAFQTNILALNAAVEAARAGQHGSGFAVVAGEVRNLAAKSAEAAKETGALIENSVEKANLGLSIAAETVASLKEIVTVIKQSAEIAAQIARSSDEQSAAIAQVNIGIEQVAQVVQLNSATAEESAAASQEMSGQSDMLAQLIAQFELGDGG